MANKNRTMLILGVILLIAIMAGQEKKEAVIQELIVLPGQNVPILGELWVKDTAIAWVPEEATKVHWYICSDSNCNSIVNQGYELLTDSEKISLNSKLTSQFKGATYNIIITAPSVPGFYWYMGIPETKDNIRVLSIWADNPASPNEQKFEVREGEIIPCSSLSTNTESVPIQNGIIKVTVETRYSGNQPTCVIDSKNDAGFEVICNSGYTANVNGRQSTCTLTAQPSSCSDSDGGQNKNVAGYVEKAGTIYRDNVASLSGKTIQEYFCQDGAVNSNIQTCENDLTSVSCPNGVSSSCWKCIPLSSQCTETDSGPDYLNPGSVTFEGVTKDDSCSGNILTEYVCSGGIDQVNVDCAATYSNGICLVNECVQQGNVSTTWSPKTTSKACGESFNQISSFGDTRAATGIACESGTCNLEIAECEEEEDEFNFGKYMPFIIIFFAFIIGMKMLKSP